MEGLSADVRVARRAQVGVAYHLRDTEYGVVRVAGKDSSNRIPISKVGHASFAACAPPLSLKLIDGHPLDEAASGLWGDGVGRRKGAGQNYGVVSG
eukprot:scaffold75006_cov36-Tisochrysis_lutea.AAC.2